MTDRKKVLESFENPKSDWKEKANENIKRYRMGDANLQVVDQEGKPIPDAKIEINQLTHQFKFGANLFMLDELETEEKNETYKKKFAELFNMATLPFYWCDTEPQKGKTRYAANSPKIYRRPAIDLCLEYCKEHNIEPREHALAYDHFFPDWLANKPVENVKQELEHHMKELADRYADKINTIEVTNEMWWQEGKTNFYKDPEYVSCCFKTARKYFTQNQLVVNEWSGIWNGNDWANRAYYDYIDKALNENAPIDAIGMQYHMFFPQNDEYAATKVYYDPENLNAALEKYSTFKKPIQITEVTIPAYSNSAEDEEIQATLLENLYTLWFSTPNVEQIVYWNLIDGYAYVDSADAEVIRNSQGNMKLGENIYYGGLLRFDASEKPAYKKLKELIKTTWNTQTTAVSDENGATSFHGFYGEYELTITVGEKKYTKKILVSSKEKNDFVIKID